MAHGPGPTFEVLTVFGCDPRSRSQRTAGTPAAASRPKGRPRRSGGRKTVRPAGSWAPSLIGCRSAVAAIRLQKDEDAVFAVVAEKVSGADAVLIPGFPLKNDDHAWLARLFDERPLPARVGRYVEQP